MLCKAQKWAPQGCPTDKATEGMKFIQPEYLFHVMQEVPEKMACIEVNFPSATS